MHLLEKHKQHFLWASIPALTAIRLPLDYSGLLGPPETKFLNTDGGMSRFWSGLGTNINTLLLGAVETHGSGSPLVDARNWHLCNI